MTEDWAKVEPEDLEMVRLMLTCEKALQSGWSNWSISKCAGKTIIRTDSGGQRGVLESYEAVKRRLGDFNETLRRRGIRPNEARGTNAVEAWLDREFPGKQRER